MKIAIIGGAGFVASNLTKLLLEQNNTVVLLDKKPSLLFPELSQICDVRHPETMREHLQGMDAVINLAAEHRDDVSPLSLYDEVNVQGAEVICTLCEELNIHRIIFTSSVAIYGFSETPTDESGGKHYFNDYGRTKWLAEEVYRKWLEKDAQIRSLFIVRPTVIFGEGNRGNVYNLLNSVAQKRFLMIGSGKNRKSMAYIGNIIHYLASGLNAPVGETVSNYIDEPDLDMNTLIQTIYATLKTKMPAIRLNYAVGWFGGLCFDLLAKITHKKFPISRIRIKKFCMNTLFTSKHPWRQQFQAPFTLQEAITQTVTYEFIEDNSDKPSFETE